MIVFVASKKIKRVVINAGITMCNVPGHSCCYFIPTLCRVKLPNGNVSYIIYALFFFAEIVILTKRNSMLIDDQYWQMEQARKDAQIRQHGG